jgi:hypothetical protein
MNNQSHPNARLRFWIWLCVWSALAGMAVVFLEARTMTYESVGVDANTILMRWGIGFVIAASSVFIFSYLGIRAWRNRPNSRRTCFWLGVASVTLGILLSSWQIMDDMMKGQACTLLQSLSLVLVWSVILLAGLSFLFSFGKFFRWLFCWRIIKRGLLALAVLIALIATFYAEENWRGKRAWENYHRECEAKGEKLELISFAPIAMPDE